jgi:hypothetical protein
MACETRAVQPCIAMCTKNPQPEKRLSVPNHVQRCAPWLAGRRVRAHRARRHNQVRERVGRFGGLRTQGRLLRVFLGHRRLIWAECARGGVPAVGRDMTDRLSFTCDAGRRTGTDRRGMGLCVQ